MDTATTAGVTIRLVASSPWLDGAASLLRATSPHPHTVVQSSHFPSRKDRRKERIKLLMQQGQAPRGFLRRGGGGQGIARAYFGPVDVVSPKPPSLPVDEPVRCPFRGGGGGVLFRVVSKQESRMDCASGRLPETAHIRRSHVTADTDVSKGPIFSR